MTMKSRALNRSRRIGLSLACAALMATAATVWPMGGSVHAQGSSIPGKEPDLSGIWDGTPRVRKVNSETVPWGKENFPELNERALPNQTLIHDSHTPKNDCQPAKPPLSSRSCVCSCWSISTAGRCTTR